MKKRASFFLILGSGLAGLGVGIGAFGAHVLKGSLEPSMLNVFETAVRYQMYHALGLCIVSATMERYSPRQFEVVSWLFLTGIILFSGSLYVHSVSGIRWIGVLTPVGGLAWIGGWVIFAWKLWKASRDGEPGSH